jgi:hypothetical protein
MESRCRKKSWNWIWREAGTARGRESQVSGGHERPLTRGPIDTGADGTVTAGTIRAQRLP